MKTYSLKNLKMNKLYAILISLSILSCSNGSNTKEASFIHEEVPLTEVSETKSEVEKAISADTNRKVIWNATIELQVDNVDKATDKINELVSKHGAFVSKMKMYNTNYSISNDITLRIASSNFSKIISEIKENAKYVKLLDISSNDVTEEFVDIKSRLNTKKEVRERYIKILKDKTGKISEVLEAEDAIRKITEEIEAKEARLRYLNDKVKYSTIKLTLYQTVAYKAEPSAYRKSFLDKIKNAFGNGWSIVTSIFILLVTIWPIVIILVFILIWKRKWFSKKIKNKRKEA